MKTQLTANSKNSRNLIISTLIIVAAIFITFGDAINYGFVDYDDPAYISNNDYVNKGITKSGLNWAITLKENQKALAHQGVANLWHPLTWISHMTDVSIFGINNPGGHHFVNILLHALAAIALMLAVRQLNISWLTALAIATLWAIHPLKVESVAWISERKDVLSGLFFWAAIAFALRSNNLNLKQTSKLGLTCFSLALLSKPSVVILPVALILIEGLANGEKKWNIHFITKGLKRYRYWFAAAIIIAFATIMLQSKGSHSYFINNSSITQRVIPQASAMLLYAYRSLIPIDLSIDYPFPTFSSKIHLLIWFCIILGSAWTWFKRKEKPLLFFALAWWFICLAPVSGLVYVGASFTPDRYLYLASAGPLISIAIYLQQKLNKQTLITITTALTLAWASLAFIQTKVWQSSTTLFTQVTKAQPKSALGWGNLGALHKRNKNIKLARKSLLKAIEINPKDYISWHNIGQIEHSENNLLKAETAFRNALNCFPGYTPSLKSLGSLLRQLNKNSDAEAIFLKACQSANFQDPNSLWLLTETQITQNKITLAHQNLKRLEKMPKPRTAHLEKLIKQTRRSINMKLFQSP